MQYEIFQCSRKYLLQLAKYLYPKIFHSENISLQQKIFQSTRKYFYCSYGIENLLQPCLNLISWAVQCGGVASRAGNIMVEAVRSTGCHHWAGLTTTNISSSELNAEPSNTNKQHAAFIRCFFFRTLYITNPSFVENVLFL